MVYQKGCGLNFSFSNISSNSMIYKNIIRKQFRYINKLLKRLSSSNYVQDKATAVKQNVYNYTYRTHNCGELRLEDVGKNVVLCGWLEFKRMLQFLVMRDGYGKVQIKIPEHRTDLQNVIKDLRLESVLKVTGEVIRRPPEAENPKMNTGEIEIHAEDIQVLGKVLENLNYSLQEYNQPKENLRMKYRYLDLRSDKMQMNLRFRSQLVHKMRSFLIANDFVDVETPTLGKATPGGAQEFIVPSRSSKLAYTLAQSPQVYKQLLMIGSLDKYFQFARCYRDEDSRSDRQLEFTQLDLEVSFTTPQHIMNLVEQLLFYSIPSISIPFPKLSYKTALELYGSDKPNLSIPITLQNCTEVFQNFPKTDDFDARALIFRKPFTDFTNSIKNKFETLAKHHSAVKLIQKKFTDVHSIDNWPIQKLLGEEIPQLLSKKLDLNNECVLFLAFGPKIEVCTLLGKLRTEFTSHLEDKGYHIRAPEPKLNFCWITDFPLFETGENNTLKTVHHPFTSPTMDDLHLLDTNPLQIQSQAYDLVLNGFEIAGGSIRIHDYELQMRILDKLAIESSELQYLLDALKSGCPPHGGIALGLDRLIAVLMNTKSIRDVIAFPKSQEGKDFLTGAPSEIKDKDLNLYHINVK